MRDLIRLSEEELQELTTPQRLRMFLAVGVSFACGIVSLQGMAVLFTDATVVPLPGMQHTGGQIAWAAALVAMLIVVTFLIRGVIKRRLQWAIALSLLLHFLLCLSMTTVEFRGLQTRPAEAADSSEIPREEFTLPDYAGMDQPSVEKPWEKPAEIETPERSVEVDRPKMEIAETAKPQSAESKLQQEAEQVETPERQDRVELSSEVAAAMERQAIDAPQVSLNAVAQPEVTAAAAEQAKLDAMLPSQKSAAEIAVAERQQQDTPTTAPTLTAAQMQAQRSDTPSTPESIEVARADRAESSLEAAESPAETVDISTSGMARMDLQEQIIDVARRKSDIIADADLPSVPASNSATAATALESVAQAERVAAADSLASNLPEDGGNVEIARTTAEAMAAAGEVAADDSPAAEAASADGLQLSESANSRSMGRGKAASVPNASRASGAVGNSNAIPGGSPAGGPLKTSRIAGSGTGRSGQPVLGDSSAAPVTIARGTAKQAGAVGAEAKTSGGSTSGTPRPGQTGSAATASGTSGSPNASGTLAGNGQLAGPAKTSVGRKSSGLPSSAAGMNPGLSNIAAPGSSSGQLPSGLPVAGVRVANGGTSGGRGTEPSAKLNPSEGLSGMSARRAAISRASTGTSSGLPSESLEAEQDGGLVFAGPQSAAAGSGGVSGPRVSALPRRSAGLPGSNGPSGLASGPSATGARPGQSAAVTSRSRTGSSRPELASADAIAGLVKRSAAGSAAAQASIPQSLSMRTTDARRDAAKNLGGSEVSEEAVERGLEWLSRNQYPDGHWSIDDFPGESSPTLGEGSFQSDTAATGLALLAYLGAGYTHQSGKYQENVQRGMTWLLQGQKANGDLFSDETEFVWFYSHGIASIAVCEAYGLTKDAALKQPAQNALNFIVASQHPKFGGWRYRPQFESDTSVSGWQLMALKSGEMAGLQVPQEAYAGVRKWLDSVQSKTSEGQYSYHPSSEPSPAMTAEALLMRQYLGAKRSDPRLIAGANFLVTRLPDFGQRDSYYWYYATQVMFHMQGEYWSEWNAGLRDLLVTTQSKDGAMGGSWDPARPTPEKWASGGGRHYLTCVNLLMLEVYYRHLPLYLELEK